MSKASAIARALARSERAQVKAAIKAGDQLGYNRNYTRGLIKFGQEGMTPQARAARAEAQGYSGPWYHGTTDEIWAFDSAKSGSNTGAPSAKNAFWFSSNPEASDLYTTSDVGELLRSGGYSSPDTNIGARGIQARKNLEKDLTEALGITDEEDAQDFITYNNNAIRSAIARAVRAKDTSAALDAWAETADAPILDRGKQQVLDVFKRYAPTLKEAHIHDYKLRWAQNKGPGSAGDEVWDGVNYTAHPNIIPVQIRTQNPIRIDQGGSPERPQSFSSLVADARAGGNDAVEIRNTYDPLEMDAMAVLDPQNIRSPFATFDPARANRRDLLAGVVPATAALGAGALAMQPQEAEAALIGPSARTWNAANAARANAMLRGGEDAARIWQETGTFHDVTGVPWQEVSDAGHSVNWDALQRANGATIPLREAVKHPELEKAYPDLFDQGIYWQRDYAGPVPFDAGAIYDRSTKTIGLGPLTQPANGRLNKKGEYAGGEGFVFHEMAHGVQDKERLLGLRHDEDVPWENRIDENLAEVQRVRMGYDDAKKASVPPSWDYMTPARDQFVPSTSIKQSAYNIFPKQIDRSPSALARALAREAPRFNAALDTSLDVASFFDPTMGYATETARALKDLPGKVGPAGAVALAPLTGATEALSSIGQLPELGVAGGRALARAIARKPQPRGSGTYRKAK